MCNLWSILNLASGFFKFLRTQVGSARSRVLFSDSLLGPKQQGEGVITAKENGHPYQQTGWLFYSIAHALSNLGATQHE